MDLKNLIKLNLKNKIIIGFIFFPVIIGVIIFFIIMPSINDIKKIKNEIETQRIDLEVKYEKGQSLKKLTKDLEIIEPQLTKLDEIFIKKDHVLEFITTLENIASDSDVTQKFNLSSSVTFDENYEKTPIQIMTKGNFIKQLNYITNLEELNYYININKLELTFASSGSVDAEGQVKESEINMLLFADTYWK